MRYKLRWLRAPHLEESRVLELILGGIFLAIGLPLFLFER